MPQFDPDEFLHRTYYALEFQFMSGDLIDFLETAERGLDVQYHEKRGQVLSSVGDDDIPDYPGYRDQLLEDLEHRFKISLPLRVRYGALIGFTTAVEWAVAELNSVLHAPIGKPPKHTNHTVHVLSQLNTQLRLDRADDINDYEVLVQVRNRIAHHAGLVGGDKRAKELRNAIGRLRGIRIDRWHFLGEHICIHRGALNDYFERIGRLVVDLYRSCYEKSLTSMPHVPVVSSSSQE